MQENIACAMYARPFQEEKQTTLTMGQTVTLGAQFTINHIQHAHFRTIRNTTDAIFAGPNARIGQNHLKREFWRVQKLD
jgi:hypothetical protein